MTALNVLSGGAAHGLIANLEPTFNSLTGFRIDGTFGAVGTMAEKLRRGAPADLVVLTAAMIADLAEERLVSPASVVNVGRVETALAIRTNDSATVVKDAAGLRAAFLAADAIFVPDTKASTAGIHVAKLLGRLGIADEVAGRLKVYPNGATAMRHLAESQAKQPIGCTQSTEIISTPGVILSGSLPAGCELSTIYTAAITRAAANAPQSRILIELMTGSAQCELRERAGFLSCSE